MKGHFKVQINDKNGRMLKLHSLIVSSWNELSEFPGTKYWWPSCMCDIFLASRNVPKPIKLSKMPNHVTNILSFWDILYFSSPEDFDEICGNQGSLNELKRDKVMGLSGPLLRFYLGASKWHYFIWKGWFFSRSFSCTYQCEGTN